MTPPSSIPRLLNELAFAMAASLVPASALARLTALRHGPALARAPRSTLSFDTTLSFDAKAMRLRSVKAAPRWPPPLSEPKPTTDPSQQLMAMRLYAQSGRCH